MIINTRSGLNKVKPTVRDQPLIFCQELGCLRTTCTTGVVDLLVLSRYYLGELSGFYPTQNFLQPLRHLFHVKSNFKRVCFLHFFHFWSNKPIFSHFQVFFGLVYTFLLKNGKKRAYLANKHCEGSCELLRQET